MIRLRSLSATVVVATFLAGPVLAQTTPPAPKTEDKKAADAPKAEQTTPATPPPASTADAPQPPTTPVLEASGSLSVSSTPPGKVFIDDKDTGLTTPVVDLAVSPGKHVLKIVGPEGREQATDFEIEAGGSLNLNVNLPEAGEAAPKVEPVKEEPAAAAAPADVATPEPPVVETADAPAPWTWMSVVGWTGLGLGTIGLLSGAVVLTTPDPDQGTLGFGLFGTGVGLVIGGGVLLYLDTELADAQANPAAAAATDGPADPAAAPASDTPADKDDKDQPTG